MLFRSRAGYADKYGHEFTIRSSRRNGCKTELAKILEGFGDWMFYGHECGRTIFPWFILDLDAFRSHISRHSIHRHLRFGETQNHDASTMFAWYDVRSFTCLPKLVIARSPPTVPPPPRLPTLGRYPPPPVQALEAYA